MVRLAVHKSVRVSVRVALIAIFSWWACLALLPLHSAWAQNLRMTDLGYGPKKIQIRWDPPPSCSVPPPPPSPTTPNGASCITWDHLNRVTGGGAFPVALPSNNSYDDADWEFNIRYEYYLTGTEINYEWTPATETTEGYWTSTSMPWRSDSIVVTVRKVYASEVGTVDTRLDLRFSTNTLKDYKFQDSIYRGGLFAGFNQDNSKVGRTYMKFSPLGPLKESDQLWPVSGLCVYCTRLAKSGSASLVCRRASDNTWTAPTLVWSNAPALQNSGGGPFNLSWNAASPAGQWVTLSITPDIEYALANGGVLTSVLRAESESGTGTSTTASDGWAYFAKAAYTAEGTDKAPYLLYAFGGPGASIDSLTISPKSISGGDTATGEVTLKFAAPSGGMVVSLSSSNPDVTVPATVAVPEGMTSASFTVTTNTVSTEAKVAITATLGGTRRATMYVTP